MTIAPASVPGDRAARDAVLVSAQTAHGQLFAVFADADERKLKLIPLSALFRGDMRYANRLGEFLTDGYNDGNRADAQQNLEALQPIERAALSATDQNVYDVFAYNQRQALGGLTPEILALTEVRPVLEAKIDRWIAAGGS